jgi:hypothetical protein
MTFSLGSGRERDGRARRDAWIRGDTGHLPRGINNPALRRNHISETINEVKNPMEAVLNSRENSCVSCGRNPVVLAARSA